ncbi:MAG: uroporphyrinogen-III C-methyltransferase [Gammaproteobacteria bacterium]
MTEENSKNPERKHSTSRFIIFIFIVLLLLICVVGYLGVAVWQIKETTADAKTLSKVQSAFSDLQNDVQSNADTLKKISETVNDGKNQWLMLDARYLVNLASYSLYFEKNTQMAEKLLQLSDKNLKSMHNAAILPVRNAINGNLAELKKTEPVDLEETYFKLNQLDTEIDKLPLMGTKLEKPKKTKSEERKSSNWKTHVKNSWEKIRSMIIVHENDSGVNPIVTQNERRYVYENLHLLVRQAQWALLRQQNKIYQESLTKAASWTQQYFIANSEKTVAFVELLSKLQEVNLDQEAPDLNATIALIDKAMES